ncbi:ABC transporter permease [Salinisphaera sp. P385]|uniref:ABC transporter permease n=1 Tax=Spectribacter acetivorans TaxID=3075603 RepID=A0ABU3BBB1_9GAMM|nr:ABC transporter permease [Salinisphaera sp. P385]MDT0619752.1 ABC transporter permease [Salinisphaera sp. P385]
MIWIWLIARQELARLFVSPLAWTMLAVVQLLLGLLFAMSLADLMLNPQRLGDYNGVTEVVGGGLFRFATIILLLVIPLLTMRLFAEERKAGTLDLLLASPVTLTGLVLGKFAGIQAFLTLMLALTALMPLSLSLGTQLDLGMLAAGLFGLWLMMAAFAAAGLFISSLTREPTVAAVASFGLLLGIWLLHAVSFFDWQPAILGMTLPLGDFARQLSLIGHYDNLLYGIFNTADVAYYLIFCGLFLALTIQRLDMERH